MPSRLIIGLLALTIGFPLLLVAIVVMSNPSVSPAILSHILMGSIMALFLFLMIGEIKRLADTPSHHSD